MLARDGLLDPNTAYNTVQFTSADPDANQTNTGVLKTGFDSEGNINYISLQIIQQNGQSFQERVLFYKNTDGKDHYLVNRINADGTNATTN